MNLRNYDLNLLTIFDAIMEHESVAGAAEQLEMTAGAVSHAITRLRQHSADPLFIREGRGIKPTHYAYMMHKHVKEGLLLLQRGLENTGPFAPKSSNRIFLMAGEEYLESLIFPELFCHIKKQAPNVSMELFPAKDTGSSVFNILSERKADFFMCTEKVELSSIKQVLIHQFQPVIVCAKNHPRIDDAISLEQFFSEQHITLKTKRASDRFLSRLTDETLPPRNIVYECIFPLNQLIMTAQSEWLTMAHEWMVKQWQDKLGLKIIKAPFEIKPMPLYMTWHISKDNDPGIQWIKEQLLMLASTNH